MSIEIEGIYGAHSNSGQHSAFESGSKSNGAMLNITRGDRNAYEYL